MLRDSRRRLVGAAAAVGAVLTFGMAPVAVAPPAHADFGLEDLFDPSLWLDPSAWNGLFDSLFDPSALNLGDPTAGLDALSAASVTAPDFDQWLLQDVWTPLENSFNQWLGLSETSAAPALAATATPDTVTVPLDVYNTTEPLVNIVMGGNGAEIPVVVDTGSNGLVVPWYDIGWQNIGFPTSMGIGAYSGGLQYIYLQIPTTIDFGGGALTTPTNVDAVIFSWNPNTLWPTSLETFLTNAGADGILGIGPNSVGPDAAGTTVLSALPGDLNQGVLIDMAGGKMIFGANPLGDSAITVAGSPNAVVYVSIDGGTPQAVNSLIDSGGVYGTMPSSVLTAGDISGGKVAPGTVITVYSDSAGAHELYSYTTTASNAPTVLSGSGATMNTGYMPFWQQQIYVGTSGNGSTTFGGN